MPGLVAPQLVVNSRMIFLSWLPADPEAVAALVPPPLRSSPRAHVFMSQYVVDDATQTSGLGAYSSTCLGVDLADMQAPDGVTPGRWYTHHLSSSPVVCDYTAARGVPAVPGTTTVDVRGEKLVAVTRMDGVPIIRTRARVGATGDTVRCGQYRSLTRRDGRLVSGLYPYLAELVALFEVESIEFLAPAHPVFPLRPANPLTIVDGFYSPRASFAFPGGEEPVD